MIFEHQKARAFYHLASYAKVADLVTQAVKSGLKRTTVVNFFRSVSLPWGISFLDRIGHQNLHLIWIQDFKRFRNGKRRTAMPKPGITGNDQATFLLHNF